MLQDPGDRQLGHGQPGVRGDRLELLNGCEHLVAHPAGDHVLAALVIGGAGAGRGLPAGQVFAGQDALSHGRPYDLPHAQLGGDGHDALLDHAPQRRVLGLVGHQAEPHLGGEFLTRPDLVRSPLRDPDVEGLAGADDVGEGLHRLLQRSLVVVAMRLVEVHVVRAQAAQ